MNFIELFICQEELRTDILVLLKENFQNITLLMLNFILGGGQILIIKARFTLL